MMGVNTRNMLSCLQKYNKLYKPHLVGQLLNLIHDARTHEYKKVCYLVRSLCTSLKRVPSNCRPYRCEGDFTFDTTPQQRAHHSIAVLSINPRTPCVPTGNSRQIIIIIIIIMLLLLLLLLLSLVTGLFFLVLLLNQR